MIVRKLNEADDNVNSTKTTDLWVVQTSYGSDIYHVFTKKEDAEIEQKRYSEEYYNYYRKINKNMSDDEFKDHFQIVMDQIKVISLYDAIDNRVDSAIDNATMQGEEY